MQPYSPRGMIYTALTWDRLADFATDGRTGAAMSACLGKAGKGLGRTTASMISITPGYKR